MYSPLTSAGADLLNRREAFVDNIASYSLRATWCTPTSMRRLLTDRRGDPLNNATAFDNIASYSPLSNLARPGSGGQALPPMLVTAGLYDHRVSFWGPAAYVARHVLWAHASALVFTE
jgi:hypothetical protein